MVPHDSFPRDCATCHEGSSWHDIKDDFVFDHEQETGVALMGQSRGAYTFMTHLRWSWTIALGYVASIVVHLGLNRHLF